MDNKDIMGKKGRQARLENILIKEEFRTFAKTNGIGNCCVIDHKSYVKAPGAIGCLQQEGTWLVYEVGDRSEHYGEAVYLNAEEAFCDMAMRCGKVFTPSKQCRIVDMTDALRNLNEVAQHMDELGLESDGIKADIQFLRTEIKNRREKSRAVIIRTLPTGIVCSMKTGARIKIVTKAGAKDKASCKAATKVRSAIQADRKEGKAVKVK